MNESIKEVSIAMVSLVILISGVCTAVAICVLTFRLLFSKGEAMTPEEVQLLDAWEELDKIIESNQHKVPWILRQKVLGLVDEAVQANTKDLEPWLRHGSECRKLIAPLPNYILADNQVNEDEPCTCGLVERMGEA